MSGVCTFTAAIASPASGACPPTAFEAGHGVAAAEGFDETTELAAAPPS